MDNMDLNLLGTHLGVFLGRYLTNPILILEKQITGGFSGESTSLDSLTIHLSLSPSQGTSGFTGVMQKALPLGPSPPLDVLYTVLG